MGTVDEWIQKTAVAGGKQFFAALRADVKVGQNLGAVSGGEGFTRNYFETGKLLFLFYPEF